MVRIAVILFPGTNCEEETKAAIESAGMQAEIVRWNSDKKLSSFDGFVLPGGWSYEDRIRAGCISAKDPIMEKIRAEASKGKPVLGICNGAQVLVETALIPGLKGKAQFALAPNKNPKIAGFYCVWTNMLHSTKKKNAFNLLLDENETIQSPIAHAEGRFVTREKGLVEELERNNQVVFRYCDEQGNITKEFPTNPNSAVYNIAAICNKEGNVMAIMPHPERANWKKQLPWVENKDFEQMESPGPGRKIFESMKRYIEQKNEN